MTTHIDRDGNREEFNAAKGIFAGLALTCVAVGIIYLVVLVSKWVSVG